MKAVILAGGLGTRLKPLTEAIPKPLLPIGEKSVLEVQIQHLAKYGFDEIYIATYYKADYVESFIGNGNKLGVKIFFSKEEKPLGTCGPLALIKNKLDEPFLVMNGDILTTVDFKKLYDFSLEVKSDLTVVTKAIVMPFAFGNVFSKGDYITGIEEKPDIKNEIIAGIYIMKPSIFKYIPVNKYFGIDDLIKTMLSKNIPISKYLIKEFWLDIGRMEDYQKVQDAYKNHFE
jgi:NDP-sugar pyrophosphorylase family protein